ncbi:Lrp/AsnC family transcriptional regulator [Halorubellus sp. JP-L1]|uniref:Lrp/AsnC family transcriptional regulator n=1 Tax=Halorubellus sp. JP-L1 TaxID=2715753 RepID=UPI001408F4D2|nr:Lrp/AsnC family transcriptional regulator [Halorubellus sp. JP-L1]NHN42149.1 Lrp/AsnC family transcriptional regulator [Halorubellus sp. JP-L1]
MSPEEIDDTDKGIVYLLQQDARKRTVADIGDQVGVSSSTVTNRIDRLEERGVIKGYHTIVDYTKAGLGHHLLVTATVPLSEKEEMVDEIMDLSGVVSVRELLTNNENLSLEVVGRTQEDVEASLVALDSLGVNIERMEIMKQERAQPYNHFGQEFADDDEVGR